jgi:hypothetical protein
MESQERGLTGHTVKEFGQVRVYGTLSHVVPRTHVICACVWAALGHIRKLLLKVMPWLCDSNQKGRAVEAIQCLGSAARTNGKSPVGVRNAPTDRRPATVRKRNLPFLSSSSSSLSIVSWVRVMR